MDLKKLNDVPHKPGCYLWKDINNNIIYIGKAKDLNKRMKQYFSNNVSSKTKILTSKINNFDFMLTKNELEAFLLELNLITKYNPKYNIKLKNDTKFPYIKLQREPKLSLSLVYKYKKDGNKYFGPFPPEISPYRIIKLLKKVFPINECKRNKDNIPCLNYQLNLCMGYCIGANNKEKINNLYKKLLFLLNGNLDKFLFEIEKKISSLNNDNRYEEAKDLHDNLFILKKYSNNQNIIFKDSINRDIISWTNNDDYISISITFIRNGIVINTINEIIRTFSLDIEDDIESYILSFYTNKKLPKELITNLESSNLEKTLDLKIVNPKPNTKKHSLLITTKEHSTELLRIEGKIKQLEQNKIDNGIYELNKILHEEIEIIEMIDISSMNTKLAIGAVTHFKNSTPNYSYFRKYNLTKINDDYENIYKTILKHFESKLKNNLLLPNLLIVDGKYQVNNALKALKELNINNIKVIGLLKNDKHKTEKIFYENNILNITSNDLLLLLSYFQEITHNYAIRFLRRKIKIT